LLGDDLVLGIEVNGEARAYPHNVLWWHEVVNDFMGGSPVLVTFCPLTGSGLVFSPLINARLQNFGVSGLLFDNNNVMFDRGTKSLWSQMMAKSICGSFRGAQFRLLPVVQSTWRAWKSLHPDTTVVSFNTGFDRDYRRNPYRNYIRIDSTAIWFPQSFIDRRRPLKENVLGIVEGEVARAYPYTSLGKRVAINDTIDGRPVLVVFDEKAQMALPFERRVEDPTLGKKGEILTFDVVDGSTLLFNLKDRETGTVWSLTGKALEGSLEGAQLKPIATYTAFWFAWAAFNRNTEIYTAETGATN
jgi:hypothetical protein